jgi:hypothetical protein
LRQGHPKRAVVGSNRSQIIGRMTTTGLSFLRLNPISLSVVRLGACKRRSIVPRFRQFNSSSCSVKDLSMAHNLDVRRPELA